MSPPPRGPSLACSHMLDNICPRPCSGWGGRAMGGAPQLAPPRSPRCLPPLLPSHGGLLIVPDGPPGIFGAMACARVPCCMLPPPRFSSFHCIHSRYWPDFPGCCFSRPTPRALYTDMMMIDVLSPPVLPCLQPLSQQLRRVVPRTSRCWRPPSSDRIHPPACRTLFLPWHSAILLRLLRHAPPCTLDLKANK